MDETEGRCISCGFLAHSGEVIQSHEHLEVSPEQRATPHTSYGYWSITGRKQDSLTSYLVCYLSKADLLAEVYARVRRDRAAGLSDTNTEAIEAVLRTDRRCPSYCAYQVGLSPKEHLMERRLLGLEEDRRKFEKALDRGSKRLMLAALILGALLALGQIVAAFFATPDGHGSRWLRGLWPPPPPPGINDHV